MKGHKFFEETFIVDLDYHFFSLGISMHGFYGVVFILFSQDGEKMLTPIVYLHSICIHTIFIGIKGAEVKVYSMYSTCILCGRNCGVDREKQIGYCRESSAMRISLASLHFGEEPPIVGRGGSGTVFFSGCSLGCSICQNFQISRGEEGETRSMGREVGVEEFARICLTLEREGAENINLVTGTHFIPSILEGLRIAGEAGLSIPIVWNSSGFDSINGLSLLVPEVDIFLVDCKTLDRRVADYFFNAPAYPRTVQEGLDYILRNRALEIEKDGEGRWNINTLRRGTIIRHLVVPGYLESTRKVLAHYSREYRDNAVLSLMAQYTPPSNGIKPKRGLSVREYEEVMEMLDKFGIEEGFLQEPEFDGPEEREWLPDFSKWKVFPSVLAKTVWHWREVSPRD